MENLTKLLENYRELCHQKQDIEHQLEGAITNFKGTIIEALRAGLVKPAIPTSQSFRRYLNEKR